MMSLQHLTGGEKGPTPYIGLPEEMQYRYLQFCLWKLLADKALTWKKFEPRKIAGEKEKADREGRRGDGEAEWWIKMPHSRQLLND